MILTARDIAQQLSGQAERIAKELYPNGKREGHRWKVGSVAGEAGKSMSIEIGGPNAGVWADFAGDGRGDLLDLIAAAKNISLGEAIKIAKDWLGIRRPESVVPQKTYRKPSTKIPHGLEAGNPVFDYLTDERKIDYFTIQAYMLSCSLTGKDGPEVWFPYYDPGKELVNIKYLCLKRAAEGKKITRLESGCALCLFGWQAVPANAREVVICEGEIDAMTWHQMGFHALSVPNGCQSDQWIDYEWDNLTRFDTIYLSYDCDAEGRKGVKQIAQRLGLHRCLIVNLGDRKDANEALQFGNGEDFFRSAITSAKPIAPDQIKTPKDFSVKVLEKFYPVNGIPPGFFPQLFDQQLGMRPGEVSLWTGIAGHGKSALLNQLMLQTVLGGTRVAIASMEMPGEATLYRMLCQSECFTKPHPDLITDVLDWLSGKLWIYDLMGNVAPRIVRELMEYSFSRHGVSMFVIDSLMKCSIDGDDYNAQRVFLNDLCSFAHETGTHINLVAHSRKGRDELDAPGKLDVKGSSDIINQPDNILTVWRNKDKENKIRNGAKPFDLKDDPDTIVYCNKQRETGIEFAKRLHYSKLVFRFHQIDREVENLKISERLNPEPPKQIPSSAPPDTEYEPNFETANRSD